jgi:hypothetical protein
MLSCCVGSGIILFYLGMRSTRTKRFLMMLNMNSKPRIFTTLFIDLQTVIRVSWVAYLMFDLPTKFHMPNSDCLLVLTERSIKISNSRHAVIL